MEKRVRTGHDFFSSQASEPSWDIGLVATEHIALPPIASSTPCTSTEASLQAATLCLTREPIGGRSQRVEHDGWGARPTRSETARDQKGDKGAREPGKSGTTGREDDRTAGAHLEDAGLQIHHDIGDERWSLAFEPTDLTDRVPLDVRHHIRPQCGGHVTQELLLVESNPSILPVQGEPGRRTPLRIDIAMADDMGRSRGDVARKTRRRESRPFPHTSSIKFARRLLCARTEWTASATGDPHHVTPSGRIAVAITSSDKATSPRT